MADATLYEKNLLFFATACPPVAELARAGRPTRTQPVRDAAGRVIDVDLGRGRLYGRPAAEFAAEQVASYLAQPLRVVVGAPRLEALHDPCTRAMVAGLQDIAPDLPAAAPRERCGILMVIGVGLGAHVGALIAKTGPRHVVLVEPIAEFLVHSLAAVDWPALWAQCEAAGATIDLVAGDDPAAVEQRLEALMRGFGEAAADGSYLYLHYQNDVTRAIAAKFQGLVAMTAILKGYYADEKLMVENMVANVGADDFWLLDGALGPPLDAPAFVVGAGPSLDATLETIRRWQDRAVVITAGSSLQALLHRGVVPDFHLEKENTQPTVDRLRHIHARNRQRFSDGRFGAIRLVASTTVQPGVCELFAEKFLFLRSQLGATAMFGRGHHAVDGTSPYSANAALTLAAIMGFREVYLFGCDCGAKDAARHHAAQTAYYTLDNYPDANPDFPLRAPGNFGGEVATNSYFAWSRWTHEQVIALIGLSVANCSDGALIAGARPLPPGELALANAPLDKAALADTIKARAAHYPAGRYLAEQDVAGVVASWHAFAGALGAHLDATLDGADDIYRFDRQLRAFLDAAVERYGGVAVLVAGSARAMTPVAAYYLNRARDDGERARLTAAFRAIFRAEMERVLQDGTALMAALPLAAPADVGVRAAG